jgi:type III pantothenate kinase
MPEPDVGHSVIRATVLDMDRFGNVQLNLSREHLQQGGAAPGTQVEIELLGERYYAIVVRTFADARPGDLILFEDSFRWISVAISKGSAAELLALGPGVATGVPVRYDDPREVGPDRIANAVAARERYGAPAIVVDFGTSTNFDVVSAAGEYIGGVLAPGAEISMDALFARAARLTKVPFEAPERVIGKTTTSALQSGLVYGFAGQVDGIVERIRGELGVEAQTVATGGLADLITPHARTLEEIDPFLTLEGVRLIWERNRP